MTLLRTAPPSAKSSTAPSSQINASRRRFLRLGTTGAVTGLLALADLGFIGDPPLLAQDVSTPDMALKELLAGNCRFVAGKLSSFNRDLAILKASTVDKQEPFAAVLSCADSRVPVELIDQTIGHIFVTRVAGNMVTPEIIASLEYGAAVLATKVILVLGHKHCGAVKAAMQAKETPGQISALYQYLMPAVERSSGNLEKAIEENALIQADLLRTASPVIAGLIKENKLKVVAGYYDLESGKVTLIG